MPSLYSVSVPIFVRGLKNLDHLLAKAIDCGIDAQSLAEARLIEDMQPLTRQVQIACDTAKFAAMRVGNAPALPMADDETTLAELRARIAKTVAYLESVDPAGFDGREDAEVILKLPKTELTFTGASYITDFALPNFFFHVTTAYALLRMKGVGIGKMDYLAGGVGVA
ncbi:hypothetical protein AWL63_01945 [Sphingomonas panacis]|uniref:DUF1993 domain-containing protein n=1 Tax=Sphingomonas panacis TaxID=1560345 RepID=A0A1B3Z673_9SPHN|nr:DUF1993 domain-containing protein [Sphingomonas panacis]AOH82923.1 hypothetical protein AWL63_01945 [Sphingomonas panacis]